MQLANTEEFEDGVSTGTLGEVLIRYVELCLMIYVVYLSRSNVVVLLRCNNVLYIRGVDEDTEM